ncbi:elongation factor 4 [bacterium]|nr:elongation factor 4 [bacterium]
MDTFNPAHIRNFSVIAHIDHGKSTLSDRLIQATDVVSARDFRDQILDTMDLERERGITIKSQAVTLPVVDKAGQQYILNLIDTPGHVDFTYEVTRALSCCEGVVLVVDATQGVQAQTMANLYMALDLDLFVIPVINKIDLISADVEGTMLQIDEDLGLSTEDILSVSAKTGQNIDQLLAAIIERIPAPKGQPDQPLSALIFDSLYDAYRGVIIFCRVFEGTVQAGDEIRLWSTNAVHLVEEVGIFSLNRKAVPVLHAGEVGYIIAGIKKIEDARVGDTITQNSRPCLKALPGFREIKPVVFSSIYPTVQEDYGDLEAAVEKLNLNDAAFTFDKDSSIALGHGFRCGFLGLLHLEIVQERLEREFNLSLFLTSPSVRYHFIMQDGSEQFIDNPALYPDPTEIKQVFEPYIKASIMTPQTYIGPLMLLFKERRGTNSQMNFISSGRVELTCEMPLAEVLYDFYDRLKTVSQGYASYDYELIDYRPSQVVKVDILVNGEKVDALSQILHKDNAVARARQICKRLRDEIPRQQFKIPIQGAIGGQIIARETINPYRKDVLAKCYGGDITRKKKLLEKQKKGKKKMKVVGSVEIPQSAFLAVLKSEPEE